MTTQSNESHPFDIKAEIDIPNWSLITLFRKTAEKFPAANAIYFHKKFKTYKKVEEEINRLSNSLKELGVKKGDRVAVLLPNVPQFYTAFFAVQALGAIFTSLSPLYSSYEIKQRIADCDPRVIITLRLFTEKIRDIEKDIEFPQVIVTSIAEELPQFTGYVYKVAKLRGCGKLKNEISYRELIKTGLDKTLKTRIDPKKDVAILQYTGGTTGIPKGAMLTHHNLVSQSFIISYWKNLLEKIPQEQFRVAGVLPYSHIFGFTSSFLWPVLEGATIFLVPDPRKLVEILKIIHVHKIHFLYGVPILFKKLATHDRIESFDLSSLHLAVSGGESLPKRTVEIFEEKSKCLLVEGYGLTEASPVTHINPPNASKRRIGTIGLAIPNTLAKIVDPKTLIEIEKIDKEGELWVRGPGVMKGYWNNKKETETVIKDGWLRTADIVKRDEQGYYAVVDRIKDIIIVSGFNVWPSEVETVLASHSAVSEAVVKGYPTADGTVVKAYLIIKSDMGHITDEEIQKFCRKRLAPYKVPKIIEYRGDFPRSPVGKILRREIK
jgi:long-chain acyl-CoA synthetase